jgi:hypothetical protein
MSRWAHLETQISLGELAMRHFVSWRIVFYGLQYWMYTILQSKKFTEWFDNLRDRTGKFRILARLRRVELGNLGDVKALGEGSIRDAYDRWPRLSPVLRATRPNNDFPACRRR